MAITNYYVTTDAMASVTSVLDEEGNVIERRSYDAFGEMKLMTPDGTSTETSAVKVDVGFQGQVRDDISGLYQMGFRWHNPSTGSWLSRDPIMLLGGANLYSYVSNSPQQKSDYIGLWGTQAHRDILSDLLKKIFPSGNFTCKCCDSIKQKGDFMETIAQASKDTDSLSNQTLATAYKHHMMTPCQSDADFEEAVRNYSNENKDQITAFLTKYACQKCPCKTPEFCKDMEEALRAAGRLFHLYSDKHSPMHGGKHHVWRGEDGAIEGAIAGATIACVVGASTGVGILFVIFGMLARTEALEHGDYGDEGPKDYESMSTLEKDAMLDELAGQIGNDLKNIASLC